MGERARNEASQRKLQTSPGSNRIGRAVELQTRETSISSWLSCCGFSEATEPASSNAGLTHTHKTQKGRTAAHMSSNAVFPTALLRQCLLTDSSTFPVRALAYSLTWK
jgi:hypothetical protein